MPKIFICYRRVDSIETAGRIEDWLAIRLPDDTVFLDVHDITPGANFRSAIDQMLKDEAAIVLVVIGKSWLSTTDEQGNVRKRLEEDGDDVRHEIELALQRRKRLIPVLVQGATMPSRAELPDSIADLTDFNAIAVRPEPDFKNDMRRLRSAIQEQAPSLRFQEARVYSSKPRRDPAFRRGSGISAPDEGSIWSRLFRRRR